MDRVISVFSIIMLAFFNLSFRWPLSDFKVTSSFGESRADHFHDGIDIINNDGKIYPISDGKLAFAWNKVYFPLENYWGGGNYKIIYHTDGLYSIYMHLEDGDSLKPEYKESDVVAFMGNTGHSYGRHLHLSILDQKNRESINPMEKLPAITDNKSPEILSFALKIADKYIILKENSTIRLTQNYPLLVSIKDSISGKENLGIYKLEAIVNGKEILNIDFGKISFEENRLTVKKMSFYDIFDEKGYYKINGMNYQEGLNTILVRAYDFHGNKAEKIFSITVTLSAK